LGYYEKLRESKEASVLSLRQIMSI